MKPVRTVRDVPETFTRRFWLETSDRAIKAAFWGAGLAVGSDQLGWLSLDWKKVAAYMLGAAMMSLCASVGGSKLGSKGTASWIKLSK